MIRLFVMQQEPMAFRARNRHQGDGYLAHGEFRLMMMGLSVRVSEEQIRAAIRSIDLDGGGFIDFPEFDAAMKRHEEVRRA